MGNYLGRGMDDITTANITVDSFDGDGVTNELTISQRNIPSSINNITVYIDGVQQRAVTDFTLSNSTITFTTAPATGQNVVAVTKGDATLSFISDSTVVAESFADGAITNDKLVSFDASKLTGTFNAIDGSALTGITEVTVVSSDPTITTNPDNVGDIYVNSTTGEMFSCTDKTTDENVWINVGGGFGDVGKAFGGNGGGTISGFVMGGQHSTNFTNIDRFSISSFAGSTNVASLSASIRAGAGLSSRTHGYNAGGHNNSTNVTTIDKFTFVSPEATASDVGDLTDPSYRGAPQSSSTHGYVSGNAAVPGTNVIERFSFATDGNTIDVGDLTFSIGYASGANSSTHGFVAGGGVPSFSNYIQKFSFAHESATEDHGDLTGNSGNGISGSSGHSSETDGYISAGAGASGPIDSIDKYSFSSSGNSTDHGNLSDTNSMPAGISSTTDGYCCGGYPHPDNYIDKFPFASNSGATDLGDLSASRRFCSGAQY